MLASRAASLLKAKAPLASSSRWASTSATKDKYKIIVIGAGTAGLNVACQIRDRFWWGGKALGKDDIAIVDAADFHYYQPGWTLVGSGLLNKSETQRPLKELLPRKVVHIAENVHSFQPEQSTITTTGGRTVAYEHLVVAPGLQINWDAIDGLSKALVNPSSGVSSIYSYATCDKVWTDIEALRHGTAIFTQPAGIIKCAGAPQKIMWMAWDRYRRTNRLDHINIDFYTGTPAMFGVKKYSDALEKLRIERGVGGYFQHNLVAVDPDNRKATFKKADNTEVKVDYTLLHVVPPQGPLKVVKESALADEAGWVAVDPATLRSTKFDNVWSLGDACSSPASKTAAAITAQTPVLTENLFQVADKGVLGTAEYDGYASCPLLTGYDQLMLCEFKYGGIPKETFAPWPLVGGDQSTPKRLFFHLKKDFFPAVYWNFMVNGKWYGAKGLIPPSFDAPKIKSS
ncbi:FAD/NAD(P)-binding domain-containing protein [Irpex rosettiformis]|uniref:FAD/NAD(P)-binding domain-containing protein n=1 Tax=Irpex rosettiformis TaxID=378272 RepID=A0ACB8UH95_9APHY|nr:FAD/NAD(P)-binding domain-containing protein [Irpex rosettiformis]